jgi:hypothetical protein
MDHPIGGGQVGLEKGVGAGGDGVGAHQAEPHHVDPQVVELAVVGVPDLVHPTSPGRRFPHSPLLRNPAVQLVRFQTGVRAPFT